MRRRFKIIMVIALVAPLMAGALLVMRWANSPVEKTMLTAATTTAPAALAPQTVANAIFSFQAPAAMRITSASDPDNPLLTHTQAFEGGQLGRQAGITTNLLPAEGLDGVADYHMRKTMTATYQPYQPGDLPAGSQAFISPANSEVTVFMVHGQRYASISITGISGKGRLRGLCRQIYSSWQWL